MTAQVYFHMQSVPRTVTRKEWYEGYRRVREMRRQQAKFEDSTSAILAKKDLHPRIRRDIIDNIINPPLILGPWM